MVRWNLGVREKFRSIICALLAVISSSEQICVKLNGASEVADGVGDENGSAINLLFCM